MREMSLIPKTESLTTSVEEREIPKGKTRGKKNKDVEETGKHGGVEKKVDKIGDEISR